jgi:hypothetical protein
MDRSWKNLTFTIYIQPSGADLVKVFGPVKGAEGFEHTFDLKNYSNGESVLFEIVLKVADTDGVESELIVIADISIGPPVDEESEPLPLWTIIVLAMFWVFLTAVSFSIILPIYSRRKVDRVKKLLKDPQLQGVAKKALNGEKPSDHFISRRSMIKELNDRIEEGSYFSNDYLQIKEELGMHKKK